MRKKITLKQSSCNKTFDKGYDEFILYCKVRNLSPATIKHYDNSINIFYKFISKDTPISDISMDTVNNFILFCKNSMNQNDVTVNTNLRSIRAVLYYFMKLEYMKSFKIQEIRVTQEPIETYTDAELKILLKKPDLKKCSFVELRNNVICNFLLGTGCRLQTLTNIKICDLDFENDVINYKHTKNRKGQVVPISNTLKRILIEYLQYREGEQEDYLFCTAYGRKVDENTLSKSLNTYNKSRGVNKTGVHRYRHTFAKNWIMTGGDIFRLQKILGHSSLDIVKNYVNMFSNDLKVDFDKFNPLEQMTSNKNHIKMKK